MKKLFRSNNKIFVLDVDATEYIRISEPSGPELNLIQQRMGRGEKVTIASVEMGFKSGLKLNWNVLSDESDVFQSFKDEIISQMKYIN